MVETGPMLVTITTLLLPIFFMPLLIMNDGSTVAMMANAVEYPITEGVKEILPMERVAIKCTNTPAVAASMA